MSHTMGEERKKPVSIADIEKKLAYHFRKPELLVESLTHRSAVSQNTRKLRHMEGGKSGQVYPKGTGSNERLEFIGDRVLGLLMAEWLLERYPMEQEGALGLRHATLVSRVVLAKIFQVMALKDALIIAPTEEQSGVREMENVQADALEAILGAIYLDGGIDVARQFIRENWHDTIIDQLVPPKDPKTALQEWLLARSYALPVYEVVKAEGPSHAPRFIVSVAACGVVGRGEAGSKRLAERGAAAQLLTILAAEEAKTHLGRGRNKGKI